MINIVLLCLYGASTGMLAENIKTAAAEENVDCVVNAYGISEVESVIGAADVVLLGPQMRFKQKELEKEYGKLHVPILTIDVAAYGMMDGKTVLKNVLEVLKEGE